MVCQKHTRGTNSEKPPQKLDPGEYGIGSTPLVNAEKLGYFLGIEKLYLKFDGANPTGSQKDRLSYYSVKDAISQQKEDITIGSCGNFGASLSYVAGKAGITAHICVPQEYSNKRISQMEEWGADVIKIPGSYETAVEESKRLANENEWYDANPGGKNTVLGAMSYMGIVDELMEELPEPPAMVSVPVGNGTTLAGVHLGLREYWMKSRIREVPPVLGGGPDSANAIVESYKLGNKKTIELDPTILEETEVNEPLLNWYSYDGQDALDAIYDSNGAAYSFSDADLVNYEKLVRKFTKLKNVLPAACASICAIKSYADENPCEDVGIKVAVLTGRTH